MGSKNMLRSAVVILGLPTLLLTGCSTGGQALTRSGFLEDNEPLERDVKHKNAAIWVSPTYRRDQHRQVVVEPVERYAPARDAEVEACLKHEFREALIRRLSLRYRIVGAPAANASTLPVRAAITNVRRTRWYINVPAQVATTVTFGAISLLAPLQGGASEEIQIEDANTGAVVAQLAAFRNGKPWNVKGSPVAYDHARMAFDDASERLDDMLAGTATFVGSGNDRERHADAAR